MKLKYKTLTELYSKTGLTLNQIAKKIHKSPHTVRKWESVKDIPEWILYQIENLAIYKGSRKDTRKNLILELTHEH